MPRESAVTGHRQTNEAPLFTALARHILGPRSPTITLCMQGVVGAPGMHRVEITRRPLKLRCHDQGAGHRLRTCGGVQLGLPTSEKCPREKN